MRRRGQVELPPFDLEPERTLHCLRKELREAHHRNLATMQNNEGRDHRNHRNHKTSRKGVTMGIMVETMRIGRLYSRMIRLCC